MTVELRVLARQAVISVGTLDEICCGCGGLVDLSRAPAD